MRLFRNADQKTVLDFEGATITVASDDGPWDFVKEIQRISEVYSRTRRGEMMRTETTIVIESAKELIA